MARSQADTKFHYIGSKDLPKKQIIPYISRAPFFFAQNGRVGGGVWGWSGRVNGAGARSGQEGQYWGGSLGVLPEKFVEFILCG